MNVYLLIISPFILTLASTLSTVYLKLLTGKNIEHAVFVFCNNNLYERFTTQKLFNINNIKVATVMANRNVSQRLGDSRTGVILSTSCTSWSDIFHVVDERFFKLPYTWLIYTDDLSGTVNTLWRYPIDIDSDFILITKNDHFYYLYEVYNTGFYTNGSFVVKNLGYFDSKLYLAPNSRTDLTGVILKCFVVIVDPVVNQTYEHYLDYTKHGEIVDSMHKMKFYTLLKYLKSVYNFSLTVRRTNSWGYLTNGSFDGLVGTLQRREADIGGSPIFFKLDRALYIDYAISTWQTRPCFILRHPKYPGGFFTIYIRPLTKIVWYWIIFILTLTGVVISVMLKMNAIKSTSDDKDSSLSMVFIFVFSAISQQGMSFNRAAISIKIVIFVTLLFTLTLYQYYNATVVSTLLREPPKSIRTLKDLLNSNLKVGVEDVLYNIDYFRRTTDPIAMELYHKKIVTSNEYNFLKMDRGMQLVKKGGFAFHIDSASAYRYMRKAFSEREICEAHEIELYPSQAPGVTLQKNSPYREHIVIGIQKMRKSGLMYRLKIQWDESKPRCVRTPDSSIFSVTLREFSSALILLTVGMFLSISTMLGEIFVWKFTPFDFRN